MNIMVYLKKVTHMRKRVNGLLKNVLRLALTVSCCFTMNISNAEDGTLTNMKDSAAQYLSGSHSVYELSTIENNNSIPLEIAGTTYYFTPNSTDNFKLLSSLSNIGNSYLIETTADNALFYLKNGESTTYYTYDYSEFPNSLYYLTDAESIGNNTIIQYQWNDKTKTFEALNYDVNLQKNEYGAGDTQIVSRIPIINSNIIYNYNYNDTGNYINKIGDEGGAINNNINLGSLASNFILNGVRNFPSASGYYPVYGGGISNKGSIEDITGDFVANYIISSSEASGFGGAIYNKSQIGNIVGNFIRNTIDNAIGYGGAIYNDGTINNLTGDFISNGLSPDYNSANGVDKDSFGGAINNNGNIYNITGNFLNNYVSHIYTGGTKKSFSKNALGGAIYNTNNINNITGDFIGNYTNTEKNGPISLYASSGGGAIYNSNSINNITGDFIKNYSNGYFGIGGAIYNDGNINNIIGEFIENSINSSSTANGGAIYNRIGTINNISGNFYGNNTISDSISYGGAISNNGIIKNITGKFVNNYTQSPSVSFGSGGAIFNSGTIGELNENGQLNGGIKNSIFFDNYTIGGNGGAIYTNKSLNIIADNGLSFFKGNHTSNDNNAIFVETQSSSVIQNPTLTLNSINNGTVHFEDKIDGGYVGVYGTTRDGYQYNLSITGDNTSKVILNNSVINANASLNDTNLYMNETAFADSTTNLNTNSGTVQLANGTSENYQINRLTSSENANYTVDVDLTKLAPVPDTITTGTGSTGTVTISDINFNGELKEFNAQILKAQDSNIQLGLSDELKEKYNKTTEETITSTDTVIPTVNWKDTFNKYEQTNTTTTGLELSTTNTTNDSIEFSTKTTEGEKTVTGTMGDTLALVNQLQTTEERNFNFDTAEDKYTVNSDLGQTTAGKLNINGVKSENSSSTVDLNGNNGFELANKSTLVVNNAKLTGSDNLITVTNSDAVVELNNAYIDGNINGDKNYNININGADTTTINGNVTSANATLNNGTLKFNSNTFAANTNTLNVNSGTVSLADNNTESYNINNLNSNANGNYTIDIDAQNQTADVLNIGTNSTGTVTISDINFINSVPSDTFKVQILNTQSDAIQLALNKELSENSYNLGTTSRTLYDTVTSTVNYKDIFNTYTQTGTVYGSLELAATNTINDSIALAVKDTVWNDDKTVSGTMGDTLALLNQLQTEEDRNFNFDTAEDKYNVTEDLGQTSAGTLNINGAAENENRSEINLNGNSGFELANNSTLNINNTKLTGNETLINVSNPDAVVNLQNSYIDGNISSSTEYGLNISGNQNDTTVINGNAGRANTTLSGSNLEFNSDTFKDASLNTRSGTVNFQNENISDYNIGKLTSSSAANYKFDIDLSGETASADKLIVGNGSSGIVTVSAIDFINGAVPDKEFIVQLIDSDSNAIQLALNSEISGQNIELGTVSKTVYDTITPTVKWNDVFNYYSQKGINYGNIGLATTETANDSLALTVTNTVWEDKTYQGSMGDTLALVNQLETKEDRNFNFDTSNDVYEVTSDLGTTSSGTININGVLAPVPEGNSQRSTINGNNHSLFKLDNATTLNLNNVKVTGANNVVTGTNKNAVVNINNSEISNNSEGIKTAGAVNISGNSLIENNGSGITVTSDTSVITLTGGIDGEITLRDRLTGVAGAKLNINRGTVNFEKKVSALDVMMEQANVNVASDDLFDGNNMTVNSASNLNMANNTVGTMHLNNLTLNDNLNMSVDVDLANKSMDRLTADSYNLGDNNVNVSNMNLLTSTDRYKTDILFADEGLRNNVTTSITEVAYSPIYKYNVAYEKDTGNFTFTRPGVTPPTPDNPNPDGGNSYDSYNPAVMASPVSSQLGGYMAMLDTYNNAFTHMDMYMLKPSTIRLAEQKANQYALTETLGVEYNSNEMNSKGMWYRPYASYDSVGLKNGPKVDNFSYGSFIGGDTEMFKTKHGFYGVVSPYVAYQGAHQSYSGNSIYQNGGTLGATATFYKGNFFTGLTAGVGMNISEASTMYGNENFPMLMAGIANKTGYNFEFKDGRYIIQPNLMLSYTFVNAFDYTNGVGVKINSDPLHAIQVAPNVRFIMNTQNGWQPYAAFGMHWNIMDDTNVTANTTSLPELSLKPYFSYGLGIQRVFKDRFTAYAQIMLRNGGRNGIAASFGGRYMLGKESGSEKQQNSL